MWYSPGNFFDSDRLQSSLAAPLFNGLAYIWEALDHLGPFIQKQLKPNVASLRAHASFILETTALMPDGDFFQGVTYAVKDCSKGLMKVFHEGRELKEAALIMPGAMLTDNDIQICPGALVEGGATIKGPSIICGQSEVRQGAYVRGSVMSLPGSIIGHATEAKNALLLDGAKAGHFAYLGDSVLGFDVNLGAGTKLANFKMTDFPYVFRHEGQRFTVKRRKFGAILGDNTATGCNTVTNPGTILGQNTKVMPNSTVAPGYRGGGSIISS